MVYILEILIFKQGGIMSDHDTFGTTQTFHTRALNEVECPSCLSIVDALDLVCTYWGFTHLGNGKVKCHVCSSIIPVSMIPPNWRGK
jgi:ribosomal protein S27E